MNTLSARNAPSGRLGVNVLACWALAIVVLIAVFAAGEASAAGRYALVIGNEKYVQGTNLAPLPYARQNADQIAKALSGVGFQDGVSAKGVAPAVDLNREALANRLQAFEKLISSSEDGTVGFLYFSGHGLARDRRGDVYLLATDSIIAPGADLDQIGFPLADIVQLLRAKTGRTVILVIDACRNVAPADLVSGSTPAGAPVPGSRDASGAVGAGWGDGGKVGLLAKGFSRDYSKETRESADYFIAFSTSPDRIAYDGDIFSTVLAEEITQTRADVLTMFKKVGERVSDESRKQKAFQLPTYEVGIYGTPPCLARCSVEPDPERFFDCPGCPWMKRITGATYMRGSPGTEPGRGNDEPRATMTSVSDFGISAYEITRAEWIPCERAGACRKLADKNTWQTTKAPIAGVTLEDAQAYTAWLSRETGFTYRLATEAEWEYAARGGETNTSPFFFGEKIEPSMASYDYSASYRGSRKAEYVGAPEAVGSFDGNAFGLYDMHGNVWEWACASAAAASCSDAVLRGGSYKSAPSELRSANRLQAKPTVKREDVGLRVVRVFDQVR